MVFSKNGCNNNIHLTCSFTMWHWHSPLRDWFCVLFPWIQASLWLLQSINRGNIGWLPRMNHKSPCNFYFVCWNNHIWRPELPLSKSHYAEATMLQVRKPKLHIEVTYRYSSPLSKYLSPPSPDTRHVNDWTCRWLWPPTIIVGLWAFSAEAPDIVEHRQAILYLTSWPIESWA